jgi:hypothetical protein
VADVCRLTCLEMGLPVVDREGEGRVAALKIDGNRVRLVEPAPDGSARR